VAGMVTREATNMHASQLLPAVTRLRLRPEALFRVVTNAVAHEWENVTRHTRLPCVAMRYAEAARVVRNARRARQ